MTAPELITEEMLDKAHQAFITGYNGERESLRRALLAVQDDMTRPVYNILRDWKADSIAYSAALRLIRLVTSGKRDLLKEIHTISDEALKGEYHKQEVSR